MILMFVEDRKSDIQLSIMALLSSTAFCQCSDSMNSVHSKVEAFKASRTWVLFDGLTDDENTAEHNLTHRK